MWSSCGTRLPDTNRLQLEAAVLFAHQPRERNEAPEVLRAEPGTTNEGRA